jgi:pyruvate formate lyase activating enzyme
MQKANIFNIQRYSIHDGDGIRTTVFFKGCPLRCVWCHNPESMASQPQLLYSAEKCGLCLECVKACPNCLIRLTSDGKLKNLGCTGCGSCVGACLNGAREIAGKSLSVDEIMAEAGRDAAFYEQSGGGVTLSGGEVMAQDGDLLEEILKRCKSKGYHTAVDTCGFAPWQKFERVMPYTDVFLYDIKHMDPEAHEKYTGRTNEIILSNLKKLSAAGSEIYIRLPLIENINCGDEDIDAVAAFLKTISVRRVYLLPYHKVGSHKRERLGTAFECPDMCPPDAERLNVIKGRLTQYGYDTRIGG